MWPIYGHRRYNRTEKGGPEARNGDNFGVGDGGFGDLRLRCNGDDEWIPGLMESGGVELASEIAGVGEDFERFLCNRKGQDQVGSRNEPWTLQLDIV